MPKKTHLLVNPAFNLPQKRLLVQGLVHNVVKAGVGPLLVGRVHTARHCQNSRVRVCPLSAVQAGRGKGGRGYV